MSDQAPANSPAPSQPTANDSNSALEHNAKSQEPKAKAPVKPKQLIDLDGEQVDIEELKRERKKYKGSEQKFRETAAMRKEVESFYEALQNDPESVLSDPRLSLKKRELAEKWLMEEIQASLGEPQDPRDQKAKELEAELKKYKDKEQEEMTKKEQAEYQQLVEQRRETIASTLSKAMELSPLSKDPSVAASALKEMAMYMRLCRDAGYEASPEEIAQHVEHKHMSSFTSLVSTLDGDELIAFADKFGLTAKIRKADLTRLKKQREQPSPDESQSWQPAQERGKRQFVTPEELKRNTRK